MSQDTMIWAGKYWANGNRLVIGKRIAVEQ
jgi:hypothetical protein